ncbi:hypothetical protein K525DRAFT_288978 [Schizophyllum commune Loenen D]|nr:hypothetical protein K525DRAFT_288978 [Schizophyllum commune Loenen D]
MAEGKLMRIFFVSFAIQTLFLGLFLSSAFLSLYFMLQRRTPNRPLDKWVFAGVCTLIAIVSAHWSIAFARLYRAFFSPDVYDANRYIADVYDPPYLAKTALLYTSIAVADMLLIYRLYIVWKDRASVIILPVLLLIGASAAEIYESYIHCDSEHAADSTFEPPFSKWIFTIFALDMSLNAYCTLMISCRIWRSSQAGVRMGGPKLSDTLVIFIESSGASLACGGAALIAYALHEPVCLLFIDNVPVVAATAYVLISVRVSLGIAREGISARRSALEWAVAYPTSDSSTEQTAEQFDDKAVEDHVKVPSARLPSSDAAVPLHRSGQTGATSSSAER